MKSGRLFTRTCCLLGLLLSTACGSRTEKASPDYPEFKMIVRLWPDHHKDSALRRAASGAEEVSGLLRRSLALHGIRDFLERSAQRIRAGHGRSGRTAAECGHRRVDTGNNARSRGRFSNREQRGPTRSSHGAISSTRGMSGPSLRDCRRQQAFHDYLREMPCPVRRAMPAVLHMAGRRLARQRLDVSRSGAAALFLRYLPQPVQPAARGASGPGKRWSRRWTGKRKGKAGCGGNGYRSASRASPR